MLCRQFFHRVAIFNNLLIVELEYGKWKWSISKKQDLHFEDRSAQSAVARDDLAPAQGNKWTFNGSALATLDHAKHDFLMSMCFESTS